MRTFNELSVDQLRRRVDPQNLPFETTTEIDSEHPSFCQPRAEKALALGLRMKRAGHIFLCGPPGTDRRRLIDETFKRHAATHSRLYDYLSVCPSLDPARPGWLRLPAGSGKAFQQDVDRCLEACERAVHAGLLHPVFSAPLTPDPATLEARARETEDRLKKVVQELQHKFPEPDTLAYTEALGQSLQRSLRRILWVLPLAADHGTGGGPERERVFEDVQRFRFLRPFLIREARKDQVPWVFEAHPTLSNLFGYVTCWEERPGTQAAPAVLLQPGSLIRAQGGFLVLDFEELAQDPQLWRHLKRCLKCKQLELPFSEPGPGGPLQVLKPEPVDLEVRLVVWGDVNLFQEFYDRDPDFGGLFRVRAEMDSLTAWDEDGVRSYLAFMAECCRREALPPVDRSGMAALIEAGAETAGNKGKLTTHWEELADLLREAAFWAREQESTLVSHRHVEQALEERRYRRNLPEEQLQQSIQEGTVLIQTEGSAVGQANGIALYETEDHAFGKPCRITAQVGIGRSGVINIEREANLSGRVHDKGVLILCGYLRDMYARNKPLNLSASLCIEQFYTDMDGDSASLGEVCALLSALAEIPLLQGIAITGSISQRGEVQAIGGANEKVTGFFNVCRERGLTGQQGVIIPEANVQDLMLPQTLLKAAAESLFHIFAVQSVDEALQILTGREAGKTDHQGEYPPGTVHRLVDDRLWELARIYRDFSGELDDWGDGGEEPDPADG